MEMVYAILQQPSVKLLVDLCSELFFTVVCLMVVTNSWLLIISICNQGFQWSLCPAYGARFGAAGNAISGRWR